MFLIKYSDIWRRHDGLHHYSLLSVAFSAEDEPQKRLQYQNAVVIPHFPPWRSVCKVVIIVLKGSSPTSKTTRPRSRLIASRPLSDRFSDPEDCNMVSSSHTKYPHEIPPIQYDSGQALMAQGSIALHQHVAAHFQPALGQAMPQMEVRFHNVFISADIVVKDEDNFKVELPTLINTVKMAAARYSAKKHVVKKEILRNVSGVLKPGTMTLVLGQPGSGKCSLLKVLGGRFPTNKRVHIEGDVTYDGTPQEHLLHRLPQFVSLVDQHDKHFPTLTVKETLEFANACKGGKLPKREEKLYSHGTPEQNQAALDVLRATYKHYPDIVIRQLGLENCQNNILGNAMLRGVWGGERKRVTTGEMAFGNKFVLLMDEISTGLDSAATFDIISTQRNLAKTLRKTVVISLLQPSPGVFADVILLNDGALIAAAVSARACGIQTTWGKLLPYTIVRGAHVVSQVPVGLMETIACGSFMYWLGGFVPTAAGFIWFELILFFVNMAFASLLFLIVRFIGFECRFSGHTTHVSLLRDILGLCDDLGRDSRLYGLGMLVEPAGMGCSSACSQRVHGFSLHHMCLSRGQLL
ncbi:unnamed protein product [Phytophthora lilii]|uniref:Unnamed protein product n=1 Tax=Phytophthora lilii TaxID=2077276 RepID=A0A9W6TNC8_9STRA|nr:unnamed protein product [Phytophthora lilii]